MSVSVTSVYNKLNAMESNVSAELVRETAASMEAIVRHLKGNLPDWLPGYRVKILDGNAIAASEHRLKSLRDCNSAPLPGKSLVVLDPSLMLAIDVFPCEDGHAQERSLLPQVLATIESDDVWIADRNFCTLKLIDLTKILQDLATRVNLALFLSHPRSTKKTKKWVKKTRPTKKPHISTAKILSQNQTSKQIP
mgnify:CR=1 FL=1